MRILLQRNDWWFRCSDLNTDLVEATVLRSLRTSRILRDGKRLMDRLKGARYIVVVVVAAFSTFERLGSTTWSGILKVSRGLASRHDVGQIEDGLARTAKK